MAPTSGKNDGLRAVIQHILRPLFRILLRKRLSFNEFLDLAKQTYLQVAMEDFQIPGRKQTVSRVSVLSGLSRKEVSRVLALQPATDAMAGERYNRAARVVAAWVRESPFTDSAGEPKVLPLQSGSPSFAELVRGYSGDMPARAVLDELLRVGAVEQVENGAVQLKARAYVPSASDADKLNILGNDVADLIATIDHNLQHGADNPRFQRKVMYDNVPEESIAQFRALSGRQAQKLLENLDQWLAQHDRDANPAEQGTGRVRAGIGIYYFEENLAKPPEEN